MVQRTWTNFVWVYFVFAAIIGNFFIMKLFLAVLKVIFSETIKKSETHVFEVENNLT